MAALTADRNTKMKAGGYSRTTEVPVAAATTIYAGALVCKDSAGRAIPAAATAGLKVIGVAQAKADNADGAAAAINVTVATGVFYFANGAGDPIVQADVGGPCFVEYDNAVCGSGIVFAGLVSEFDSGGVWVYVDPALKAMDVYGESSIETVTSGALSLYTRTSLISVTGTQAYTLAAGRYEGQRKTIRVTVAASTPDGTLTPTAFASGTSIDLDAVNEGVELEYHATGGWTVVSIVGATIN